MEIQVKAHGNFIKFLYTSLVHSPSSSPQSWGIVYTESYYPCSSLQSLVPCLVPSPLSSLQSLVLDDPTYQIVASYGVWQPQKSLWWWPWSRPVLGFSFKINNVKYKEFQKGMLIAFTNRTKLAEIIKPNRHDCLKSLNYQNDNVVVNSNAL